MIRIFADSTCDLSKELIERYDITIIPLFIVMGDKEYRDGIDITRDEIFSWSDANKTTPKTAAPSIQATVDAFDTVLKNGDEIIVFSISEEMSTTANVFRMAAAELNAEDRVTVVDSANLSTGIGLQVIEAAIKASEGLTRAEIEAYLSDLRPRVRASFVVDTLEFLRRGGRCSSVAAIAGTMFNLHPQIDVIDGKMVAGRKFRGKIDMVTRHYAEDLKEDLLKARPERVFITHSGSSREVVEEVRQFLKDLNHFDEIFETDAGGVISSHCGPGTLGVLFVAE